MVMRLLLFLLLLASPAQATIWFDDSFEGANPEAGGWDYAAGWCRAPGGNTQHPCFELDQSTEQAHSGSKSMRGTYNAAWSDPNPQTHEQAMTHPIPAGTNVYVRRWEKQVAFVPTSFTGTKIIYYRTDGRAPSTFSIYFFGSRVPSFSVQGIKTTCPPNSGAGAGATQEYQTCNFYPNMAQIPVNNDQWYCIEEHISYGTPGVANGMLEIWINNIQVLGYYNQMFLGTSDHDTNATTGPGIAINGPSSTMTGVQLFKQNGGGFGSANGYVYWDQLASGNQRIGCDGGPPPTVDTTPPSTPSISSVTALSSTSLRVTHTLSSDTDSGVGTYEIDKCTGNGCSNFSLALTTGSQTTADITGLSPSTTYTVRVRARDNAGNAGSYSTSATGTTSSAGGGGGGGGVATAPALVSTTASSASLGVVTNYSFSVTVPAGTDRLLTVCTAGRDSTTAANTTPSSVTFNGVPLTLVRANTRIPGPYWATSIWRLVAPDATTANVTVTHPAAPDEARASVAQVWTGVDQTNPIDTSNGGSGSGTTLSAVVTTTVDHDAITDCALGRDDSGLTVGSGQTAQVDRIIQPGGSSVNEGQGVSTVADKATAGAETMDWTQVSSDWVMTAAAIKPIDPVVTPPVPPVITALACDATGCDLTYGSTTPTTVRFLTDAGSEVVPIASIPGGRYTKPGGWPQNTTFICAFARDANGVESTAGSDYRCVSYTAGDTTAPTMSNPLPTGTVGSSTVILSVDTNEIATCRYSASNQSFDHMTLTLSTVTGLHHEVTLTGQADAPYTWYFQCADYNLAVEPITPLNKTTVAVSTTYTVNSAPSDTTPPSDVVGLAVSSVSPSQAQATFTAATDDVSVAFYRLYGCVGESCSDFSIVLTDSDTTIDISNLTPSFTYTWKVKAVDTSNNESVNFSNAFTLTQPSNPTPGGDIVPPSIVRNCRVTTTLDFTLTLTCDQASDNFGVATYFFEACAGLACTDFETLGTATLPTITHEGLTYNQIWTYRVIARDFSGNVSPAYSTPVVAVTPSTGWSMEQGFCPCRGRQR